MNKETLHILLHSLKARPISNDGPDKSYEDGWKDALRAVALEVDYLDTHGAPPVVSR